MYVSVFWWDVFVTVHDFLMQKFVSEEKWTFHTIFWAHCAELFNLLLNDFTGDIFEYIKEWIFLKWRLNLCALYIWLSEYVSELPRKQPLYDVVLDFVMCGHDGEAVSEIHCDRCPVSARSVWKYQALLGLASFVIFKTFVQEFDSWRASEQVGKTDGIREAGANSSWVGLLLSRLTYICEIVARLVMGDYDEVVESGIVLLCRSAWRLWHANTKNSNVLHVQRCLPVQSYELFLYPLGLVLAVSC